MRRRYFTLLVILLSVICMAGTSCTKQDAQTTAGPKAEVEKSAPMPGEDRRFEELEKGARESRKIVVAKVNGEDITLYSLVREMNKVAPKYIKPGEKSTPAIDEKIRQEALDRLIFFELAVQEAVRQGIKVRPETVDAIIKNLKSQLGSDEAYQAYLKRLGLSDSDLRKKVEKSQRFELIIGQEIYNKIHVDEKMLREEYRKNKDQIRTQTEPSRTMTYEEAKPLMERKLKAELGESKIREWEKELRKNAKVEIMPEEAEKTVRAMPQKVK